MKQNPFWSPSAMVAVIGLITLLSSGCATTTSDSTTVSHHGIPAKYISDDKRSVVIGSNKSENGGWKFNNPHMNNCWIADGFDFKGYDAVYIAPTQSKAKFKDDEQRPHQIAKENLLSELKQMFEAKKLFTKVITAESEIQPAEKTLRMENTIVEYSKGGGGARFFAGEFGAGQPVIRVATVMKDGDKTVFAAESRRSGVSGGARMLGGSMKDEDIQLQDIQSLVLDMADFIGAIQGKYQPRK